MSVLDELILKDLRKYSPLEHVIFRVWCEGKGNDEETLLEMTSQAAAELAALRSLLKKAGEALEPFAHEDLSEKLAGNFDGDGSIIFQRNNAVLTLGDARRAADIARKIEELG